MNQGLSYRGFGVQARVSSPSVLGEMAAVLSPGMAKVLEKLVAAHFLKVRPPLTTEENMLLQCAGAALSVVNRTPGAAQNIGRGAAVAVASNPDSQRLVQAVATMNQRRLGGGSARRYGR